MSNVNCRRLSKEDYDKPCKELSRFLLGKVLVRRWGDETVLKGRIVETEAYLGGDDQGAHSRNGRRSAANEPMYMPPGTSYVYMTYGMYHCFNISSREPGAAVLLRALEPVCGMDIMQKFRTAKSKGGKKIIKTTKLCDGPSKLCIAMNITKDNANILDLSDPTNHKLWLEDDPDFDTRQVKIVETSRIGIAYAGQIWASMPLRFYILGSDSVSKRDKGAEKDLEDDVTDN